MLEGAPAFKLCRICWPGVTAASGADDNTRLAAGALNNPSVYQRNAEGLTFSQLITDFGRTTSLAASAGLRARAEAENAEATRAQVLLQVAVEVLARLHQRAVDRHDGVACTVDDEDRRTVGSDVIHGAGMRDEIGDAVWQAAKAGFEQRELMIGNEFLERIERDLMLQIVDAQWKDHLYGLDHLKEGIGLRGYGQRDPLVEYQREGYDLFQAMMESLEEEVVGFLFNVQVSVSTAEQDEPIEIEVRGAGPAQPRQLAYSPPKPGSSWARSAPRCWPAAGYRCCWCVEEGVPRSRLSRCDPRMPSM